MEPRPWLEEDATDLEKALLRAGRSDGPAHDMGARILTAIRGPSPNPGSVNDPRPNHLIEPGPANGVSATWARPVTLLKWGKAGLLAVGVAGALAVTHYLARPHELAPPATPAPAFSVTLPVEAPSRPAPREDPATPSELDPLPVSSAGNLRGAKSSSISRVREAPQDSSQSPLARALGEETIALDHAREALAAHQAFEALRLLDDYHRRFPRGRMRPEAMVLRLAALVQSGNLGAANALASQLLADNAYKTYATRIRSLLREGKR